VKIRRQQEAALGGCGPGLSLPGSRRGGHLSPPDKPDMTAIATLKPLERLAFGFLFVESALEAARAT
jgi:hypothetical protein